MKQINLLNEFFNSKSDANKHLETSSQEELEDEFESWFLEKLGDFEFVSRLMIKHLAENYNPHTSCLIDSTHAEILEGQKCFKTEDYLTD